MQHARGVRMVVIMSTDDTTASDEMKRKFKEALEKKNAQQHQGEAHLNGDSAVHGTHGPNGGHALCEEMARRGVLAKETHGATIRLAPPLTIRTGDLHHGLDVLGDALRALAPR